MIRPPTVWFTLAQSDHDPCLSLAPLVPGTEKDVAVRRLRLRHHKTRLLEVAVDDVDQLLSGVLVKGAAMFVGIDEVGTDVFLDDLGEQAVHRAATGRDQVHDFGAPCFTLQGALDSVDLTADTADAVQ